MKVFVIAGEASGDRLGGALLAGLRRLCAERGDRLELAGVGGVEMAEEGLSSLFPMQELSVMGLAEVLPRYLHLRRRLQETVEAALRFEPDVVVTIDSPGFCLRVAAQLKARAPQIRRVHYVAPTVWAWRPRRAAKLAALVDQCLALFPFEPPLLEAEGMRCDFVGHPVVSLPPPDPDEVARLQTRWGPAICVLPGSRESELRRLCPVFGDTLRRMNRPDLTVIVPVAPGVEELAHGLTADWPGRVHLVEGVRAAAKLDIFAACRVALAASGTVSLELAAAGVPMVIAYDMSWFSRIMLRRMLLIDTVTLVNIVSDTHAVPEFIGAECRPELIAPALLDALDGSEAQQAAMARTLERLGQGGIPPGLRAAQAVLDGLDTQRGRLA